MVTQFSLIWTQYFCVMIYLFKGVMLSNKYKTYFYYINTNEIPGELSRENLISSHVKILPLVWQSVKILPFLFLLASTVKPPTWIPSIFPTNFFPLSQTSLYPCSREPFSKYLIWNKPCLQFNKALGASSLVDAALPRTISIDKKKNIPWNPG